MKFDKKNTENKINSVMLKNIGDIITNVQISKNDIDDAMNFYSQLSK